MRSLPPVGSSVVDDLSLPVHDLIGIGFGPSNLALAIAAVEHNDQAHDAARVAVRFFERQPSFRWYRGMLLDDATMRVSFLKDLVTLRNPASSFSFPAYLHAAGRLVDFINHKSRFPLRAEFNAYLEWAAARVADLVDWGHEVIAIEPVAGPGGVVALDVTARELTPDGSGRQVTYRARNVIIGTGRQPRFPEGFSGSEHVWHAHRLLRRAEEIDARNPRRFVVVGAGPGAAEVTAFLRDRFPGAEALNVSRVERVREQANGVAVAMPASTGDIQADLAVFATGDHPVKPLPLLGALAGFSVQDRRDYRVVTAPGLQAGIYLQGGTEHTPGLASSLLSTVATRAGEILASVVEGPPKSTGGAKAPVAALRRYLR